MKKVILSSLVILVAASAFAGGGTVGSDAVKGSAQHFYSDENSDAITELAKDLHDKYGLFVANFKQHSETYVGDFNLNKMKNKGADVVAYSDLTFSKSGESYRLYYNTYKTNRPVIITLDSKYNSAIEKLFLDIKQEASFVEIDGATGYGRGGSHLTARNLSDVKELTLTCTRIIQSDLSGGNRCQTKTSGIDFAKNETEVIVQGAHAEVMVPKKYLRTWSENYWNGKF